jgi:hypothetical protein
MIGCANPEDIPKALNETAKQLGATAEDELFDEFYTSTDSWAIGVKDDGTETQGCPIIVAMFNDAKMIYANPLKLAFFFAEINELSDNKAGFLSEYIEVRTEQLKEQKESVSLPGKHLTDVR